MQPTDAHIQAALQGMLRHYQSEGHEDVRTVKDVIELYGDLQNQQHISDLLADWENVQHQT